MIDTTFPRLGKINSIGNPGLFLERIGAGLKSDKKNPKAFAIEKKDWIAPVARRFPDTEHRQAAAARMKRIAERAGGLCLDMEVLHSRLVAGIANPAPVENSMHWHPVLGVPYIPGSTVKGLVQAWALDWLEPEAAEADALRMQASRIFGRERAENGKAVERNGEPVVERGSVIFHDALPIGDVVIECDVMTPHVSGGNTIPDDLKNPTPILFPVVASARFRFLLQPSTGFLVRGAAAAGDLDAVSTAVADCAAARGWLAEALEWIGIGAKTKAGYGRMTKPADRDDEA